jgi:CheY-like chemotaxis protein
MTKGSRILVVEDEMVISLEIVTTLKRLGYEIAGQAVTGADAIWMAGDTNPDLILMDIRLRDEMDGIEAALRIQEQSDCPIIFLTAHSDEATLERAIAINPTGYLIKPFKDRELYSTIELALHKHDIWQRIRPERLIQGDIPEEIPDSPAACLLTINPGGVIVRATRASGTLLGTEKSDIIGTRINRWILGTDHKPDIVDHAPVIIPGRTWLRRADGRIIPVRIEFGYIGEEDNRIQGYLLALTPLDPAAGG